MKSFFADELAADASALLKSGASGFAIATFLTDRVDTVLRNQYDEAVRELPHGGAEVALLAVGGYGRREMMPYSDIDIMLLVRADTVPSKELAQSILYRLWDRGMHISHAYRTLKACIDDSMKDMETRTSLMDARFLAGSETLFEEYRSDVVQKLLFKDKRAFVGAVIREVDRRHRAAGASLYVLEPNVKEGQGGLRDVHALAWLARSELRLVTSDDYGRIWPHQRLRDFAKAHSFLLRVRAGLHALSARRNDTISAEYHDDLADLLGFRKTGKYFAAEIMLRIFYRKAKTINDALASVMRQCGRRYFTFTLNFGVRKATDHFAISKSEIIARDDALLRDPATLLEAFSVFAAFGKPFSAHLEEQVRARARRLRGVPLPSGAVSVFRDILRGQRVYETLRHMHDTGVLDLIIPEFGRIRHLVILEAFHRYTVDEHTLLAIRFLESLLVSQDLRLRFLADLFRQSRREIIYPALLLHDIGKGISRHHEEAGYIIIKGVLERIMPGHGDRQSIEFLVRNHIMLAKLALTRDIDAPETVPHLAEIVEHEDNLNMLYLMTYADMAAVNEGFWNAWKASMLQTLFIKTRDHLRGLRPDQRTSLSPHLRALTDRMTERYLLANTKEEMTLDQALSVDAERAGIAVAIAERADGTAECTIVSHKKPRLFARIAGVLSLSGFNIVRARLFTGNDGLVIRRILLSNWKSLYWDGVVEQLRERIASIADEDIATAPDAGTASPMPPSLRRYECFIELDNEATRESSILEVMMPDRKGLLYDIAKCVYALDIDILSAIINTEHAMAQDVFYLQKNGAKLDLPTTAALLSGLYVMSPRTSSAIIPGERDS